MSYDTHYTLKWDPVKSPNLTPEWLSLVSEIGEKSTQALYDRGVLNIGRFEDPTSRIREWIASHKDAKYALNIDGSCRAECSWYSAKEDIRDMSRGIRDVLFTLSGEGEESGDLWNFYALNGKTQLYKAIITYEPCTLVEEE